MVGDGQRCRRRGDAASSQRRVGREYDLGGVPVRVRSPDTIAAPLLVVTKADAPAVAGRLRGLGFRRRDSPGVTGAHIDIGSHNEVGGVAREAATAAGAGDGRVGVRTGGGGGGGEVRQTRIGHLAGTGVLPCSLHGAELEDYTACPTCLL